MKARNEDTRMAMSHVRALLGATALAVLALGVLGNLTLAQDDEPITQDELVRQTVDTTEGAQLFNVRRVELAPGAEVSPEPTMEHPAQEFVYLLEGTAELWREGQDPIEFTAGEAWHNDFELSHTLRNASEDEPLVVLVVWVGEEGAF